MRVEAERCAATLDRVSCAEHGIDRVFVDRAVGHGQQAGFEHVYVLAAFLQEQTAYFV